MNTHAGKDYSLNLAIMVLYHLQNYDMFSISGVHKSVEYIKPHTIGISLAVAGSSRMQFQ